MNLFIKDGVWCLENVTEWFARIEMQLRGTPYSHIPIRRAWNADMDIQFVLDPYACAKYLMSYTTKPEREMSLLLEATHKECREGNMSVRGEMKKLTGIFFNHRQVSAQDAIYRAAKMPLTHSSRGFVFVLAHSNSGKVLKPYNILKQMNPDDEKIFMSSLADKYFDKPKDSEFCICMADFASENEIISITKNIKDPKESIKRLQTPNLLLENVVCLIQANLWGAMHSRLTQTMGIHPNTAIFGNVEIIAIGDFCQ
ncbi:unnamed protein product [Rotaria sp. Silwood1]|nr:unnamed protein product [Rotaria sp. Silwood1]CAF4538856.1 unnamed protein product [Rotaria sp. Silwood1]CAF4807500.1 unnamed protein product [Rotaria sp. Silwood1]